MVLFPWTQRTGFVRLRMWSKSWSRKCEYWCGIWDHSHHQHRECKSKWSGFDEISQVIAL